eukprot:TRINITY_DN3845_c0_g2_i1.p1 TRINITY_DN3845_c0_g2~~TRINITY_DN3845_c0_g2_i1.p1  ORF type:complete len:202 (+),score=35.02 TRINITY_DN3845_c0_g2_i1:53-658(+)
MSNLGTPYQAGKVVAMAEISSPNGKVVDKTQELAAKDAELRELEEKAVKLDSCILELVRQNHQLTSNLRSKNEECRDLVTKIEQLKLSISKKRDDENKRQELIQNLLRKTPSNRVGTGKRSEKTFSKATESKEIHIVENYGTVDILRDFSLAEMANSRNIELGSQNDMQHCDHGGNRIIIRKASSKRQPAAMAPEADDISG